MYNVSILNTTVIYYIWDLLRKYILKVLITRGKKIVTISGEEC